MQNLPKNVNLTAEQMDALKKRKADRALARAEALLKKSPAKKETTWASEEKKAPAQKTSPAQKPGGKKFQVRINRLAAAIEAGTATEAMKKEYEKLTGKKVK